MLPSSPLCSRNRHTDQRAKSERKEGSSFRELGLIERTTMADEWVTVTKQSRRYGKGKGKGGEGDHQHHPHPPAPAAAAAAEESQRSVASIQASLRQCRDTVQFSQLHADIAAAIVNNAGWGKGAHGSSSSSSSGGGGAGGGGGAAVVGDATAASEVATGTTSEDGRSSLIRPKTIVCYGVGNFGHMPQARFQFAMLQVLATTLEVPPSDVYVYDPCFTRAELAVLAAAGHTAIGVNEECKRAVDSPTLFYMVHCGLDMYVTSMHTHFRARMKDLERGTWRMDAYRSHHFMLLSCIKKK